jgi:hypothetical protein
MTPKTAATLASIAVFLAAAGIALPDRSETLASQFPSAGVDTTHEGEDRGPTGDPTVGYFPSQFVDEARAARIEPLPPQF